MNSRMFKFSGIEALLIIMALLGGFYHLITQSTDRHDVKMTVDDNIFLDDQSVKYGIHPLSSYEIIPQRNLFQSLYPTTEKTVVISSPKIIQPEVKSIIKVEPIKSEIINTDLVITGIVNDGKRKFALVENLKSRESRFVAIGESVSGLKLVDIGSEAAIFDANGQRLNVSFGGKKSKEEKTIDRQPSLVNMGGGR